MQVTHVRLARYGGATAELVHREAVDGLDKIAVDVLPGDRAREFLAQVRLPAGPVVDTVEGPLGIAGRQVQFCSK